MLLCDLIDDFPALMKDWPTGPLVYHHQPARFAELLTLAQVDEWIDHDCVALRNIVLIGPDGVLPRNSYTSPERDQDMPVPGCIRKNLDGGGTISLRNLQDLLPALSRLRDDIQHQLGCFSHVNAYLTPGRKQGLKYHYDPYVTMIVQLSGSKAWPLHPPMVTNPTTEYQNFLGRGWTKEEFNYLQHTPPEREIVLDPGDVLWLPRGWAHAPHTVSESPSLHLTFAIRERTRDWASRTITDKILDMAMQQLESSRAEISHDALAHHPEAIVEETRDYLLGLLATINAGQMGDFLRHTAHTATG